MEAWAIVAVLLLAGVLSEWRDGRRRAAMLRAERLEAEQAEFEMRAGRRSWAAPTFQCRCVACGAEFEGHSRLEVLCGAHRPKVPNG